LLKWPRNRSWLRSLAAKYRNVNDIGNVVISSMAYQYRKWQRNGGSYSVYSANRAFSRRLIWRLAAIGCQPNGCSVQWRNVTSSMASNRLWLAGLCNASAVNES